MAAASPEQTRANSEAFGTGKGRRRKDRARTHVFEKVTDTNLYVCTATKNDLDWHREEVLHRIGGKRAQCRRLAEGHGRTGGSEPHTFAWRATRRDQRCIGRDGCGVGVKRFSGVGDPGRQNSGWRRERAEGGNKRRAEQGQRGL